ncbi:glycogen operon protein [Limimaricola soesokkakensis]|uniref:Glycogen debranching enzyme n=1 Tax=Limimaricola soesokkakensis TaxID=1343159 RepID=A0A1X6YG82_9RHOB|nr:glycogen debranching protein GlgX [Limimaricola soesokkakensis]PSK82159.1 glycogen operon protein [Limimaricola soesokkakensis]SLN19743.1 Glycogen debranching enzyme [Limimaricola soesokkakensis]
MSTRTRISAGRPHPLGATPDAGGVNFAVFSQNATRMQLCLFERYGRETARIDMPEREGHVWHCYIHGLKPGQHYGFRAHGPYRPDEGHRFNPNKLLLDPYARQISGHAIWHDALHGYDTRSKLQDLSYDTRDSAPYMPRAVVADTSKLLPARHPDRPMADTVIYEAHVAGLTADRPDIACRGRFQGLASDKIIDHLGRLGVTAIELLPVHAFINDRFLVEKGLSNYWGYQSIGFFAPEPRYLASHDIAEFRAMVDRFHAAGIEVLLDVVYNHTGEGNQLGPTLCFRGLDNASYYRLAENRRYNIDDTGTGNTLNIEHPMVLRMVMDSLRYWVEVMGVDGFRFDLCTTLGRRAHGFDRNAPFFQVLRQDPVLGRVKLIAEPWDIGPGGYQLGAYPAPFAEWNDKFRDEVRDFWRGTPSMIGKLAARISGSAQQFDHDNRPATSSINFLTAHDGFTLMDVVSYNEKHNEANGEDNRDGHSANHSDNMGVEGPTDDSSINAARARRRRNMLATLMISQGTPMILAGDELGNSQQGNNNAYCQNNEIGWVNWDANDPEFLGFVRKLVAFRRLHPILRQKRFLHARSRKIDNRTDLFWRRADGRPMTEADWEDPERRLLAFELRTASGTPDYAALEYALFAVINNGGPCSVTLPAPPEGHVWVRHIDSARPQADPRPHGGRTRIRGRSVVVMVLEPSQEAPNEPASRGD